MGRVAAVAGADYPAQAGAREEEGPAGFLTTQGSSSDSSEELCCSSAPSTCGCGGHTGPSGMLLAGPGLEQPTHQEVGMQVG